MAVGERGKSRSRRGEKAAAAGTGTSSKAAAAQSTQHNAAAVLREGQGMGQKKAAGKVGMKGIVRRVGTGVWG